jgi:hypothetical protein
MENMLWLPPDYRAICAVFQNGVLAMGHTSGLISILEFSAAEQALLRGHMSWFDHLIC